MRWWPLLLTLGACKAPEGATCKNTDACADGLECLAHRCTTQEGMAKRCRERCRRQGNAKCTAQGDQCVIGSDADCALTPGCAAEGRCTYRFAAGSPDVCVAAHDEQCAASDACNKDGRCIAVHGRCAPE